MYLNTNFEFDGIKSIDMNVGCYHVDKDLVEYPFGVTRTTTDQTIDNKVYINNILNKPIEFDMIIAKINGLKWTYEERLKITDWLFKDDYKPLRFCDNYFLVYFAIITEAPIRYDIGNNEGYIKVHVKCQNPYTYGDYGIELYDLSKKDNNFIKIKNRSNTTEKVYPIFCFESLEEQDISFKNYNSNANESIIEELKKGEYIILDNNKKEIKTSLENVYRLNDFNKNWFYLNKGINKIQVKGKIKLKILYEFPIMI